MVLKRKSRREEFDWNRQDSWCLGTLVGIRIATKRALFVEAVGDVGVSRKDEGVVGLSGGGLDRSGGGDDQRMHVERKALVDGC